MLGSHFFWIISVPGILKVVLIHQECGYRQLSLWICSNIRPSVLHNGHTCMCAKSLQSCLALCDLMDCSFPGSSVRGIIQARILERVVMPSTRGSSQSKDQIQISLIAGRFLPSEPPGEAIQLLVVSAVYPIYCLCTRCFFLYMKYFT